MIMRTAMFSTIKGLPGIKSTRPLNPSHPEVLPRPMVVGVAHQDAVGGGARGSDDVGTCNGDSGAGAAGEPILARFPSPAHPPPRASHPCHQGERDSGVVLARPLLPFTRSRLEATCRAHGLAVVEDPTNRTTVYRRNAVRAALEDAYVTAPALRGSLAALTAVLGSSSARLEVRCWPPIGIQASPLCTACFIPFPLSPFPPFPLSPPPFFPFPFPLASFQAGSLVPVLLTATLQSVHLRTMC